MNCRAKGFTLIELMVTLAVLAILATVGIPAFQRLVAENRVSSQANSTQAALQFARSEALKRRNDVIVCQEGSAIIVRPGSNCNGVSEVDPNNLLVVPINPRVEFSGLPENGLLYVSNGYISPFTLENIVVDDPDGVVDTRTITVVGSGFSEIVRGGE